MIIYRIDAQVEPGGDLAVRITQVAAHAENPASLGRHPVDGQFDQHGQVLGIDLLVHAEHRRIGTAFLLVFHHDFLTRKV